MGTESLCVALKWPKRQWWLLSEYVRKHLAIHFKWVYFMVYEVYLNKTIKTKRPNVVACSGCHNKSITDEAASTTDDYFSLFWRLDIQEQGTDRFSVWWGPGSWSINGIFSLSPHRVEGARRWSVCVCVCVCAQSRPAYQASLSMEFSRQEYWSWFPFPSLGNRPDSGIKPGFPVSPAWAGGFFPLFHLGNPAGSLLQGH